MNQNDMSIVMLVGVSRSGKSTFYKNTFSLTHLRINKDTLNTNNKVLELFKFCLKYSVSCILDNTNLTKEGRKVFIDLANVYGVKIHCYFLDTPFETCFNRDRFVDFNRKDKIPDVAIKTHFKILEPPDINEGFERIKVIK